MWGVGGVCWGWGGGGVLFSVGEFLGWVKVVDGVVVVYGF